jgi:hypothetical protein
MCSPMMIETAQSDGWRQDVCVLIESIGRGRYNWLESFLLKTIHPTLLANSQWNPAIKGSGKIE